MVDDVIKVIEAYSNTTLVKVKSVSKYIAYMETQNSNTTLVKVKSKTYIIQ